MSSPSPSLIAYDYEEIRELRGRGWSWVKLGNHYGRNYRNVTRWFERQRLAKASNSRSSKTIHTNQSSSKSQQHTLVTQTPTRLIKYGTLPVTDYSFINGRVITIELILEWIRENMSHIFNWQPDPAYIIELIDEIFFNDFIIVLEPRKHGKTIALICLFAFWIIELKRTLLVLVSDWSAQKRIFYALRHALHMVHTREKYGDLIQSESASDFTLMYQPEIQGNYIDPFLRVASIEGKWVGSHAAWTHQEDVQQQIAVSEKTRQRLIDNYDDNLQDMSEKNTASATRKGELDYYGALFKRGWKPLHRKAVEFIKGDFPAHDDFEYELIEYDEDINENPIGLKQSYLNSVEYTILGCPDFSFEKLMIRYWRNPDSFFTQYQNEAVTKRAKFFDGCEIEVIESYTQGELANQKYMFIDPAFSEAKSKSGSKVAMLIIVPFQNKYIIEDVVIKQMSPAELDDWGEELFYQYNPNESKIEDDFAQITTRARSYSKLLGLRGMGKFYNRNYGSKDQRIQTLYGYGFRRQIKIYKTAQDRVEFMRQWRSYNKDARHGFDGLDILASAVRILYDKFKSNVRVRSSRVV